MIDQQQHARNRGARRDQGDRRNGRNAELDEGVRPAPQRREQQQQREFDGDVLMLRTGLAHPVHAARPESQSAVAANRPSRPCSRCIRWVAAGMTTSAFSSGAERIHQPRRVGIAAEIVPRAANDQRRRDDAARLIGQLARHRGDDIGLRTVRNPDRRRCSATGRRIRCQIGRTPLRQIRFDQDRRMAWRYVLDKALPLIRHRHDPAMRRSGRATAIPRSAVVRSDRTTPDD